MSEVIGKADIYYEEDGIYLGNFEIYPSYINQGLGNRTLKMLIKNYNVDTIICECDNIIAYRLYTKNKFKVVKRYFAIDLNKYVYYMKRKGKVKGRVGRVGKASSRRKQNRE